MANKKSTEATLKDVQPDNGLVKVLCGWTIDDQYLCQGMNYGPGIVEVTQAVADHLVPAIIRVNATRDEDKRIDPIAVNTPRPVQIADATIEELQAQLDAKLEEQNPIQPVVPIEMHSRLEEPAENLPPPALTPMQPIGGLPPPQL